jgi:hypothetical protein
MEKSTKKSLKRHCYSSIKMASLRGGDLVNPDGSKVTGEQCFQDMLKLLTLFKKHKRKNFKS